MLTIIAPYAVIFFLNLIGGAVAAFGVGLALHTLALNWAAVFIAVVIAETASDSIYYCIGRFASTALHTRFATLRGTSVSRMRMVQNYYDMHGRSTVFLAKMSDVLAIPGIVIAGAVKMPYGLFLAICFPTSILKTALILTAGFFIGKSTDTSNGLFFIYGLGGVFLLVLIAVIARSIFTTIKKAAPKR